jgi:hypothetical protein
MEKGSDTPKFPQHAINAAAGAGIMLAMQIAWQFADILVAKEVLTSGEARAAMFALADAVRRDAEGISNTEASDRIARWLEDVGMRFAPPKDGSVV